MNTKPLLAHSGSLLIMLGLLAGCSEPQQPATALEGNSSQATAAAQSAADAAFAASTPVELSLEERRLALTADTACNLERANRVVFSGKPIEVSKSTSALSLSGWVANKDQKTVPAEAVLRLISIDDNRAWKVGVNTGGKRDDVVALLGGDQEFSNAGYAVTMDIGGLPVGTYRIYTVFGDTGALKVCDNGRSVLVED